MPNMNLTMMNTPIPGESLTRAPNPNDPMMKPPKVNGDIQEVYEYIFSDLISEDMIKDVITIFEAGTAVDAFVQMYLTALVKAGYINMDQMLLSIEPTVFMIMALCKSFGIQPRLTRRKPKLNTQTQYIREMKQGLIQKMIESKAGKKQATLEEVNKPKSLPTGGLMGSIGGKV